MPLTALQRDVLRLLSANRNPESHAGGGAVLNRGPDSPRYSSDLDLFHDVAESVAVSAAADAAVLQSNGFAFHWLLRQPFLQRAEVEKGADRLRLDWCFDSAFRFFPVQPDPDFGWCLHPADLATNKVLAVAGRSEVRDFIDILHLDRNYLSLGAICWAACGKDLGFTPWTLMEQARRNMKFDESHLQGEHLTQPVSLSALKESWLRAATASEAYFSQLPPKEVGCLYLTEVGNPVAAQSADPQFAKLRRHFGSVKGAWPAIGPTA